MVNVHLYAQDNYVLNSAVDSVRVLRAHDSLSMPLSEVTECHQYSSFHPCLWYGHESTFEKGFAHYNYSCNVPRVQQCQINVYISSM